MGIEPTHKGFADLLSAAQTLAESIHNSSAPLIRNTFRSTSLVTSPVERRAQQLGRKCCSSPHGLSPSHRTTISITEKLYFSGDRRYVTEVGSMLPPVTDLDDSLKFSHFGRSRIPPLRQILKGACDPQKSNQILLPAKRMRARRFHSVSFILIHFDPAVVTVW